MNETTIQQQEQKASDMPVALSKKLLGTIIALSLLFGGAGGAASVWFLKQNPEFVRSLPVEQRSVTLSEDSAVIDVVEKASPAVVSIIISKDVPKYRNYSFDPFSDFPFFGFGNAPEESGPGTQRQEVGEGSGFFISPDGLILTNKHVVEDEAASYTVITEDNKQYEATVLARDPRNDLALIKVDVQNMPYLKFADSSQIRTGQRVVAIGNSLGQYRNTVTTGVISAVGRSLSASSGSGAEDLSDVIQTDAAINPGNSGGPLLNVAAEVVGINTAMARSGQLIGFAIPSNDAKRAVESYEKNGKIVRPFLGIRYTMITKDLAKQEQLPKEYGALLTRGEGAASLAVIPGSPADTAGLAENDIILEINGTKVEGENTIARLIRNSGVGDSIRLKVYHRGEEKEVTLVLEEAK